MTDPAPFAPSWAPDPADADRAAPGPDPRWGLGDAIGGWVLAYGALAVFGSVLLAAFGYTGERAKFDNLPLTMIALQFPPLWLGFVLVPVWAAATKGDGVVRDFRLRLRPIDVPLGLAGGLFAQFVLVPAISLPILKLAGKNLDDLAKPAQDLADKAHGSGGVILFAVIVAIGAPIAEELFFRGLLLRAVEKRWTLSVGVAVSSVVFGVSHFEPLQMPALVLAGATFGLLAARTNRLGPAVIAHMTFNAATVVSLVAAR